MITCLYIAVFTYFLSLYMFIPFFSLYVKELGGSYVEFAFVLSVTGFILSIIQSYVGYLSDKFGPRKLVVYGGGISSLGFLLIGILYNKIFIVPFYILMNIGMGIVIPSVFTMVSYMKNIRGDSFIPQYRSIQGLGIIVGPILGGFLMKYSFRISVIISSIIMFISIIIFYIYFESKEDLKVKINEEDKKIFNFKEVIRELLNNKKFIVIMLLFTFVELSYDLIRLSLPIVGSVLNIKTDITGMALSAYFIMFTLFQIPINNSLKKLKKKSALILMGVLSLLTCSLLLLNLPSYFILVIMGGIGLTIGSLFTFCSTLALDECPEDKKGTFMGIFNTILPFTDIISPIAVAILININIKFPYAVAAGLIILFIILSSIFYTDRCKKL